VSDREHVLLKRIVVSEMNWVDTLPYQVAWTANQNAGTWIKEPESVKKVMHVRASVLANAAFALVSLPDLHPKTGPSLGVVKVLKIHALFMLVGCIFFQICGAPKTQDGLAVVGGSNDGARASVGPRPKDEGRNPVRLANCRGWQTCV